MVRRRLVAGLLMIWLTVLITGCLGKGISPFPVSPTQTLQSNALPTPTPTAFPGPAEEGKPTLPGGEQPFVPPPTVALPSPDTAWQEYEIADVGIRIRIPAEWEALRMPGGYIFAANGQYLVNVTSCCVELPHALPEFQEALVPYLRNLHEKDFTITPMKGAQWEGVGVWHHSNPNICLTVYIPTPEMVRQIGFIAPVFCESNKEQLVPLGEMILDSVEILSP